MSDRYSDYDHTTEFNPWHAEPPAGLRQPRTEASEREYALRGEPFVSWDRP